MFILYLYSFVYQRKKDSAGEAISLSSYNNNSFVRHQIDKLKLNKIAARWPAKAVAQFFYFFKKGSDRIVPR